MRSIQENYIRHNDRSKTPRTGHPVTAWNRLSQNRKFKRFYLYQGSPVSLTVLRPYRNNSAPL